MRPPPTIQPDGHRTVIVHYHFFKCAGTSVAHALRDAFGDKCAAWEGPGNRAITAAGLSERLEAHPEVVVVSSHTAIPPPPELPGTTIIPVVLLRHPIDRARSVYEFERVQSASTPGALMAKQLGLTGFIRWGLENASFDPRIAEFQTSRLGGRDPSTRALRAMSEIAGYPFVGVVEEYAASLAALEALLRQTWPDIRLTPYQDNAMRGGTLAERLDQFRRQIGTKLYQLLEEANQSDLELWRTAIQRYRPGWRE